ncbi:hypothetical protein BC567DRAFT_44792 [Phyllosticta citribraziliensis]
MLRICDSFSNIQPFISSNLGFRTLQFPRTSHDVPFTDSLLLSPQTMGLSSSNQLKTHSDEESSRPPTPLLPSFLPSYLQSSPYNPPPQHQTPYWIGAPTLVFLSNWYISFFTFPFAICLLPLVCTAACGDRPQALGYPNRKVRVPAFESGCAAARLAGFFLMDDSLAA